MAPGVAVQQRSYRLSLIFQLWKHTVIVNNTGLFLVHILHMTFAVFQESVNSWRKIKEAIVIHHKRPFLNRDRGYNPPPHVSTCYHATKVPYLGEQMTTEQTALADEDFEKWLKIWQMLVSGVRFVFLIKLYFLVWT